jgi:ABC-type polysaccharide/polyol phosphate transport system ATPase subunit
MSENRVAYTSAPAAISVHGVAKKFRIPQQRVDSLKERVLHPSTLRVFRELDALRDISFEVRRGEFFGIVGRNGSGKSTLLKIMASIYAADAGRIRITGHLAPFIELGVGFNPEMTAHENIVLNGVMMGLRRREAERRLDEVLEFAELEDFVELKLKNYSSGMLVRLAFSVMMQSDADILLIDEVLAVGDAAFQQKCTDAFMEMRDAGRTVVLVSHDMAAVERFCDRAMLLEAGVIVHMGEPEQVADHYTRLNFEGRPGGGPLPNLKPEKDGGSASVRIVDAWLEAGTEARVTELERGIDIHVHAVFEGLGTGVERPLFGFMIRSEAGVDISSFGSFLNTDDGGADALAAGERVHYSSTFDNRLTPGRYHLLCRVMRGRNLDDWALETTHVFDFTVNGDVGPSGVVTLSRGMIATRIEPGIEAEAT